LAVGLRHMSGVSDVHTKKRPISHTILCQFSGEIGVRTDNVISTIKCQYWSDVISKLEISTYLRSLSKVVYFRMFPHVRSVSRLHWYLTSLSMYNVALRASRPTLRLATQGVV